MSAIYNCTKVAIKSLKDLGGKTKVLAFSRKFDPNIGEELTHRITGQRFFRDADLLSPDFKVLGSAREITQDGYRGITKEQFEELKKHTITKKPIAYGDYTLIDSYTGGEYWYRTRADGKPLGFMNDFSTKFHSVVPESWAKRIKELLG